MTRLSCSKAIAILGFRIYAAARGQSLAQVRQAAMQECRGEWIAFLDQDDIWLPGKLGAQLSAAEQNPECVLIYGRTLRYRERKKLMDYDHRHEWTALPEGRIFEALFRDSCFPCMSSVMVRRRETIASLPMPAYVHYTPDYFLYLTLCQHHTACAIQEPVCLYRWHRQNISKRRGREVHAECVQLVEQFSPFLDAALATKRYRVHQSLIAFSMMCHVTDFWTGAKRLVTQGSVAYVASRPFVRVGRWLKRALNRPVWQHGKSSASLQGRDWEQTFFRSQQLQVLHNESTRISGNKRYLMLGIGVNAGSFAEAREFVAHLVTGRLAGYVCNANVYSVMLATDRVRLRHALARAAYVVADGMPIVWLLRAIGQPAERVHGDELFLACCERFPSWKHFLVGGRAGQAELVADELRKRFPAIDIVGVRSTPKRSLSAAESAGIVDAIRSVDADIVWVGMGTPAQDYWMGHAAQHADRPMVGVGSAFDMLSGHSRPTPHWMKQSGLQWLFRLVQEPRRLMKRYAYYNSRFVVASLGLLIEASWRRTVSMHKKRKYRDAL